MIKGTSEGPLMSIVMSFLISASFFAKNSTKISESFVQTVKSPTQLKTCIAEEKEKEATTRITLSVLKSPISRLPSYRAERDAPRSFP